MISVKYLEDRLDQERRMREQLETELRMGKSMMAQLSSKIDHLQTQIYNNSSPRLPSTETPDNLRLEVRREMEKMNEVYLSKIGQLNAECMSLKSQISSVYDSDGKKYKCVLDEVDQLKNIFSSYMSKTSELHQDHVSKENLLMIEQSKTSGVPNIVATHDQWIQNFQKHANMKFQQLELAFSSIKSEISTVVENEARLKFAFETLIKEVATDLSKNVQNKMSILEGEVRRGAQDTRTALDARKVENEKMATHLHEQGQILLQKIVENRVETEEMVKIKLRAIEEWLSNEQTSNAKREFQMRADFESSTKQLEERLMGHTAVVKEDLNMRLNQAHKSLQTSVSVLEESSINRNEKLEKIVRSEIEQRLEAQKAHDIFIGKLQESTQIIVTHLSTMKTTHTDDMEKMRSRIELVQNSMKEIIQSVAGDVSINRKLLGQLQRALEELQNHVAESLDSEKQAVNMQIDTNVTILKTAIQQLHADLDEVKEETGQQNVKIEFIAGDVAKHKQLLAALQNIRAQVEQLESWKETIPENVISKRNFDDYSDKSASFLGDLRAKIQAVEGIINESNVLRTTDLVQEFGKLKAATEEDHQYLHNELQTMAEKLNQSLSQDVFNKTRAELYGKLDDVDEKQRLINADLQAIQGSLATKISQSQWEVVDVHIKNLKQSLGSLSSWIHENSVKQSNDVHKVLLDLGQQVSIRQQQNLVKLEEVKDNIEKKIDNLTISMHDQAQKNHDLGEHITAKVRNQEENTTTKLEAMRNHLQEFIKDNTTRIQETERRVESLKQNINAVIDEKLIPLATKTELQAFESNIKLLGNEIRQVRDGQRGIFEKMKAELDVQIRKFSNESATVEKQFTNQELYQMRTNLRQLQDAYDQKHAEHIQRLRELNDKVKELETRNQTESLGLQMNDGKLQDIQSQLKLLESDLRKTTESRVMSPMNMSERPFSSPGNQDMNFNNNAFDDNRRASAGGSANIFKPNLRMSTANTEGNIKSTTSVSPAREAVRSTASVGFRDPVKSAASVAFKDPVKSATSISGKQQESQPEENDE